MRGDEGTVEESTNPRQQAEIDRRLRENERWSATLLSNLPGMVYRCKNDSDWTMEFVSDGCEALTGCKAADFIGNSSRSYNSLIHQDDQDRVWHEVQDAVGRRVPFRLAYRLLTAAGKEKWVAEQGVGVFRGDELEALEGFVTDITDLKDAESGLRAYYERFQGVVANTDAGYFRIGMDGCYEDVNLSWARMHGFSSKEEVIGKHFSSVQVPEDTYKAEEVVQALARGESVRSGEFSRLRRDGTIGYHSFSANPVFDGDKVVGIEGFLVDMSDWKTADEERQQSERRYRALFDSMHEGVAIHKLICTGGAPANYLLLDVNRRYEETLGVKREQVVNQLATDAYQTKDAPYLREYASVVQSGIPLRFETYFPPLEKHFAISVAHMGDDLFATIFFDLTEQKKAEERYKLISENTADVIWLWSLAEGRCEYISPSVRNLRGLSAEEIMAQSMDEAMPPDTYLMVLNELQRRTSAFESGDEGARVGTNEIEFLRNDGTTVATETVTTLLPDERGAVRHVIGVSRDITERKAAQDALRRSEEKFSTVFRSSPVAKSVNEAEDGWRFVDVNEAFERITGYRRSEVVGRTVAEMALWADSHEKAATLAQLQTRGGLQNVEHRFRKKNGDIGTGLLSVDFFEINGKPYAVVANVDITERKRAEEEKSKLEDQLRQAQKLESVGRLAGGVAHDFNNLLTVISGYAELMSSSLDPMDPLWPAVEEIRRAGERAAGLTKQLLAFSRKQLTEPQTLDLNSAIKDSERILQRIIGEDITLTTRLDPSLGQVMADPGQVHQVIMNLVVNARDAMPAGGSLDIATTNVEVSDDEATEHADARPGRYVWVTVKDTGSGMDAETLQHIFEPFFTTKDRDRGTGLGLSTVYGIVQQSGGWIDVSSEVGVGTSFTICFPRIDGVPVEGQRGAAGAAGPHGSETILLVEDQDAVRRFAKAMLVKFGYQVVEAANGDEATGIAETYPGEIHLLVTDVVLPGINGRELSERLQAVRPTLKTLFTSGYTADVIADRGVLNDGVAYIPKPFTPDGLAAKVREVLTDPSHRRAG